MQRTIQLSASAAALILIASGLTLAQQNYKIKQTVSTNGQSMTNTTYVRGARKRTENGAMMGVADIQQCDLKRNIRVSDKKRLYTVEPFDSGDSTPAVKTVSTAKAAPVTKGGVITYINNVTDTGERKQMFGMTARHLKTSTKVESSPDACNPMNMKTETDGWYIDLPEFSCPISFGGETPNYNAKNGGCQDRVAFKNTGAGKLGFPLSETRTMSMEGMSFTQSLETVEFSKALLEATLFDIPASYSVASNSQDLYSTPDYSAMIQQAKEQASAGNDSMPSSNAEPAAFTGTKIGVVIPSNRGEGVPASELQTYLVERLRSDKVMGVAVTSEAEARSMNLDYVLTTDITKLKQSTAGKIGGMFGKVTGASTAGAYDAQVEFKLARLSDSKITLSSKASDKSQTEAPAAARNVLGMEASAVIASIK